MAPREKAEEVEPLGTGLSNEQFRDGGVLCESWEPVLRYAWDKGVAMRAYLDGLKAGRLTGVRCKKCDRTVIPPRAFCEKCFGADIEFVPLPSTGTVNTFSITHVRWDMVRLEKPQIPAVIDVDGTNPRAGILHLIDEVEPAKVKVGMKVQAVFKPASERTGAITDIRHWKPVK